MIIWNGKDTDVFLTMLESIERGQTFEVAVDNGAVKTLSSYEDLRGILPPRNTKTEFTRPEYEEILNVFMPSEEMREHLLKHSFRPCQIIDLILGSPVSLETKAEYCRQLTRFDDVFHGILDDLSAYPHVRECETGLKLEILKAHAQNSFTAYYKKIRAALDALELRPGELLLLNEAWYDEDYSDENESRGSVPLLSLDAALRYIRDEMQEEEWDDDSPCWTKLEKWGPAENGEMEHLYTYYLIRDEIVFFEKNARNPQDHWLWHTTDYDYSFESVNLNLPIPYHPEDIVEVNCLPFAPVKHVLLLEVGSDCCGVTALFLGDDGKWSTGALKHGHCWGSYRPMFSPLYRIRSHNRKILFEGERLLLRVQEYVAGDADKGRSLWNAIYNTRSAGLCDEELLALRGVAHDREDDKEDVPEWGTYPNSTS